MKILQPKRKLSIIMSCTAKGTIPEKLKIESRELSHEKAMEIFRRLTEMIIKECL